MAHEKCHEPMKGFVQQFGSSEKQSQHSFTSFTAMSAQQSLQKWAVSRPAARAKREAEHLRTQAERRNLAESLGLPWPLLQSSLADHHVSNFGVK
eukprot:4299076-Amphidinium_carterae.1